MTRHGLGCSRLAMSLMTVVKLPSAKRRHKKRFINQRVYCLNYKIFYLGADRSKLSDVVNVRSEKVREALPSPTLGLN